jgi:hypothetical protein
MSFGFRNGMLDCIVGLHNMLKDCGFPPNSLWIIVSQFAEGVYREDSGERFLPGHTDTASQALQAIQESRFNKQIIYIEARHRAKSSSAWSLTQIWPTLTSQRTPKAALSISRVCTSKDVVAKVPLAHAPLHFVRFVTSQNWN